MNAVEIEEAVSNLAEQPFDPANFPYAFLEAFGNKTTTIQRLRSGSSNKSDIEGCVLQHNNIHISISPVGKTQEMLGRLRESPATTRHKAKFILATDGIDFQAEDVLSGETVACEYKDFPDHFGFFLPLAGISTVKQIRESSFDIKATGRLNRLYVQLLKDNPDWGSVERRPDMNHFMARLIFCFFAEDTEIFSEAGLFTKTVQQMSASDSSNTHEVIGEIFRAMNTTWSARGRAQLPRWADYFPYVNGGLFSGNSEVPRFSKIARSYLVHIGSLEWKKINPDIFGSMIQAVAEDEERGALGMHYTSVPNILRVLNPLFLDDLRSQLEKAGDNARALLNLRRRISRIRVFDPACGSGNFLVIAYKEMRSIEAEINRRRKEDHLGSEIHLTNFRGIELRDFPAEVARLALIIAEYQCDVLYRGQKEALAEFLPLESENWIFCGNALQIDWLHACPPSARISVTNEIEAKEDDDHQKTEIYICGNPPFTGTRKQTPEQKADLEQVFAPITDKWKNVDYVGAWFLKAALYNKTHMARFAFVATNSLCQGQQVPITWPILFELGFKIRFAHTSFRWENLAVNKAGVTVIIVGLDRDNDGSRFIYNDDSKKIVSHINPYLTEQKIEIVKPEKRPLFSDVPMDYGVYYSKSAGLILSPEERKSLLAEGFPQDLIRRFLGSTEFINGKDRYCLWISDEELDRASTFKSIAARIQNVRSDRLETSDGAVNKLASRPHQFRERKGDESSKIFIPIVSSENREYFPVGLADKDIIPTNKAFFMGNAPLWVLSILVSRIHLVWIATVCGRLEMRFSYSNILGWNTFPIPKLTEQNKSDLTRCAEDILLAREAHFPFTIAELYDPDVMPEELRRAHELNDEVLERTYIGRRFRNDSERIEKLFDLYSKKVATAEGTSKANQKIKKKEARA